MDTVTDGNDGAGMGGCVCAHAATDNVASSTPPSNP
jgi:hypothetical protein